MTFEEYAQENLVKHGFTEVDMTLIRMGWNAAKADGADIGGGTMQAARAQGGEAVAEVRKFGYGRIRTTVHHLKNLGEYPEGTKLYTLPSNRECRRMNATRASLQKRHGGPDIEPARGWLLIPQDR